MIEHAKSKGIKVELASNATLLEKKLASRIVESNLDYIELSIDSPVAETYERIRTGAKFEKVEENIKNLVEARGVRKKPDIKILAVVQDENVCEMPELINFAARHSIYSVMMIHVQPWSRGHEKKAHARESQFRARFNESMIKAKEEAQKKGVYLDISSPSRPNAKRACKRAWLSTSILADGHVVPCCRVISPESISFGNIFEQDFRTIWNSKKYQAFRKVLKASRRPSACVDCYFYGRNPLKRDHI
jgi:radical SAM protein with 4Fe4S-binding SPASM domain